MKIKLLLISIVFFGLSINSFAQDYNNAIGLRGGWNFGITGKHFISTTDAIEGILSSRWGGFQVTGLYERHTDAFDVANLYLYYGGGVHIGVWDNSYYNSGNANAVIGIDGIIGLEYVFSEIPINISLDFKPAFDLIGDVNFFGSDLALSGRFIF